MRRSVLAVFMLAAALLVSAQPVLATGTGGASGGGHGGGHDGGHAGGHAGGHGGGHGHGHGGGHSGGGAGHANSCPGGDPSGWIFRSGTPFMHGSFAESELHATRKEREHERAEFQRLHPCPVTGQMVGRCPGYRIDLIVPRENGGGDHAWNMRWQPAETKHE